MLKRNKIFMSLVLTLGIALIGNSSAFAKSSTNVKRLAGQDRYETCFKIVSDGWQTSDYAIIVNGENFPDALSASPLAKKYNAPILLTESNNLTSSTKEQLQKLGVKNVFIIGGTGVVNTSVENTLKSMGISTKRIYGQDRFETSTSVAKELNGKGIFIVSGETYEDALSIAPIASQLGYSITLVGKDYIPDTVKNYVKSNNVEINVIGGQDVISDNVANTLKANKIYNQATKYERNLAIINDYKDKLDLSKLYVASDKGFADALSGSALAGLSNNPIILVGNSNQESVNSFIKNNNVSNINVLGGTGVLAESMINNIVGGNDTPTTPTTPIDQTGSVSSDDFNKFYSFIGTDNADTMKKLVSDLSSKVDKTVKVENSIATLILSANSSRHLAGNGVITITFNSSKKLSSLVIQNEMQFETYDVGKMLTTIDKFITKEQKGVFADKLNDARVSFNGLPVIYREQIKPYSENGEYAEFGLKEDKTNYGKYSYKIFIKDKKFNSIQTHYFEK